MHCDELAATPGNMVCGFTLSPSKQAVLAPGSSLQNAKSSLETCTTHPVTEPASMYIHVATLVSTPPPELKAESAGSDFSLRCATWRWRYQSKGHCCLIKRPPRRPGLERPADPSLVRERGNPKRFKLQDVVFNPWFARQGAALRPATPAPATTA